MGIYCNIIHNSPLAAAPSAALASASSSSTSLVTNLLVFSSCYFCHIRYWFPALRPQKLERLHTAYTSYQTTATYYEQPKQLFTSIQ